MLGEQFSDYTFYVSDEVNEVFKHLPPDSKFWQHRLPYIVLGNIPNFEILAAEIAKEGQNRCSVLFAQGDYDSNTWAFYDRGIATPVQKWIQGTDGLSTTLLVFVCNPGGIEKGTEIRTKKSLLVYPLDEITVGADKTFPFSVYSPKRGHVGTFQIPL